jgi:hypothetical protein
MGQGRRLSALGIALFSIAACAACAANAAGDRRQSIPGEAAEKGKVYGEFEDSGLFEAAKGKSPVMAAWSEKDVMDGLSGATIQSKTMGPKTGRGLVLLSGKKIAYADGFGQFWIALAPGRYSLLGRCPGYKDARIEVEVKAGENAYANFYMRKK